MEWIKSEVEALASVVIVLTRFCLEGSYGRMKWRRWIDYIWSITITHAPLMIDKPIIRKVPHWHGRPLLFSSHVLHSWSILMLLWAIDSLCRLYWLICVCRIDMYSRCCKTPSSCIGFSIKGLGNIRPSRFGSLCSLFISVMSEASDLFRQASASKTQRPLL